MNPGSNNIHHVYTDSCLIAGGAHYDNHAFVFPFANINPDLVPSINHKECLCALMAIVHWKNLFANSQVIMYIDNIASVAALQNARPENHLLRKYVRSIWHVLAVNNIHITFMHSFGNLNVLADKISRMLLSYSEFDKTHRYLIRKHYRFRALDAYELLTACMNNSLNLISNIDIISLQDIQSFIRS